MFPTLVVVAIVAVVPFALYLVIDKEQRNGILNRIGLRSIQLPQLLATSQGYLLEKQDSPTDQREACPTYKDSFPPNRRHVLAQLPEYVLPGSFQTAGEISQQPSDYSKLLPDKSYSDDKAFWDHVSATGFSLAEIKHLGDFPDYALLSGVPLPEPYEEFDIKTALPRPYRPFRWAYHQTMSLTKLEPDWWLELDRNYVEVVKKREKLFEKHGNSVIHTLPGSELAAKELMEMCLQFLCARYPQYFHLDKANMIFHNSILQTQTDLKSTLPMHTLLHHVPEDFAIMIRDPGTGLYSFRGGMIMSSLGWNLGSKIGLKLHEIHKPIPDYKEKMQRSMDRYFAKKPTDKAIQRGSWGLEIDKPLYMPPGDPHELHREKQDPDHTLDQIHLRVDWQTLRRLPLSGAVIFNFKGLFTPIAEFRDEPYIPSLVLKVLKEGKKNMMEYKSTWHTEHIVIPALERYEKEQMEKGLIEEGWEPRTLDEAPFYAGWEEKWHRQQGF